MVKKKETVGPFPGTIDGMFVGVFQFDPLETINDEVLIEFFSLLKDRVPKEVLVDTIKKMKITVEPDVFEELSENTKKHFTILTRQGNTVRYTPVRKKRR